MMAAGFVACSEDTNDSKKANGDACEKAEECTSDYCDAESHKCADKPAANDSKKANGDACEKAEECTSDYCDAESHKCADKPQVEEKTLDDKITEYCKAITTGVDDQISCVNRLKDSLKDAKEKMPDCYDKLEANFLCNYNNKDKGEQGSVDACESQAEDGTVCVATNYIVEYFLLEGQAFCEDEDNGEDKTVSECLAQIQVVLEDQQTNYPDCLGKTLSYYICTWHNLGQEEAKCAAEMTASETCFATKYPSNDDE